MLTVVGAGVGLLLVVGVVASAFGDELDSCPVRLTTLSQAVPTTLAANIARVVQRARRRPRLRSSIGSS
ncbi:MAG: hypothetical protein ACXVGG_12190 [Mycobacteriaceae bacterium]